MDIIWGRNVMKNLKLRTKLSLLQVSAILMVVLGMLFAAVLLSQAPDFVAKCLEQKAGAAIDPVQIKEEVNAYIFHRAAPFLAVSAVYVLLTAYLFADILRHAAWPIHSLEGTMKKIAEGNFAAGAADEVLEMQEETGNLARAMEQMRKNVSVLVAGIQNETSDISHAVKGAGAHMGALNGEMEDIFTAAEELSALVKNTEEAAGRVGSFSSDIEASARRLAARAKEGIEWASDIKERAVYSKEAAAEKSETVRLNQKTIRDSLRKTLKDARLIEQISVLAESVVELTEQTNLLSLNAGIEAAKIGDAGKQFTAAIEEIRNLTEQSKKYAGNIQWATDEVTSVLVSLRKDAKRLLEFIDTDIVSAFQFFVRMAETYKSDAGEMKFLVEDFGQTAAEVLASAGAIPCSVEEIEKASKECAERITGISDKSVHAAARTSSMAKEFGAAERAAARLDEKTGRFTVGAKLSDLAK